MFDWLGRTLMLVLSGLATFAILASLESASRGGVASSGGPPQTATAPDQRMPPPEEPRDAAPRQEAAESPVAGGQTGGTAMKAPAPPSPVDRIASWLEALTYAVLALAGFAAAILVVLLRITATLARIAERA